MRRHSSLLLFAATLAGSAASLARADDFPAMLDVAANPALLDARFSTYGYLPTKSIQRDKKGVRFRLPASSGVPQTGLYSTFALAGDFEFSVTFEVLDLPSPKRGNGVSCGIAVDAKAPHTSVLIERCNLPEKGNGYVVTKCLPDVDNEPNYTRELFDRTSAKIGRLCLRRVKGEVICLVADDLKEPLREFHRVSFPTGTIRQIRILADTGGAANALDMRIGNIVVGAGEITGGIPQSETGSGHWWWLGLGAVVVAGLIAFRSYRRRRDE